LIESANSALEALQIAQSAGIDLSAPIARDAWKTAARALDTAESELEIIIFDRDGALLARTPIQRARHE
ncbi:MAG: cbiD, partial [Methylocystaceae bacterium]